MVHAPAQPYRDVPRFEKPATMQDVVRAISG
jgi:hypothetical protein